MASAIIAIRRRTRKRPEQRAGAGDQDAGQQDNGDVGAHTPLPFRRRKPGNVRRASCLRCAAAAGAHSQTRPRAGAKQRDDDDQPSGARMIIGPVGKPVLGEAEQRAGDAGERAEERGEDDHRAEPVRPLPCRRGRPDQHRRHQHHADGLQPMTTATTIREVSRTLSWFVLKPRLPAKSGSKVSSLNSL